VRGHNQYFILSLTLVIPAGAHQMIVHPLSGENVHGTFAIDRLTSQKERL
jgi:hypothetical protein